MMTDSNLNEIREKIYKLRTAIMYSMSNEVCKLPNCIVTALQVDDEGQLWFTCPKPLLEMVEYESSFPVRLHFYHKGIFFHMEVSGKASIVDEDYSGDLLNSGRSNGKQMLILMSMNSIEYVEPYGKKERSRIELLLDKSFKWVLKNLSLSHTPSRHVLSKNSM